jgi:hypothetical protein
MPSPPTPAVRRLLHLVPVRVRHYWKLLAGCVALVAVLTLVVSAVRVQPYVTSSSDETGDEIIENVAGTVDLFDGDSEVVTATRPLPTPQWASSASLPPARRPCRVIGEAR